MNASGRPGSRPQDCLIWDNHACLPLDAAGAGAAALERHRRAGTHVVSVNLGDATVDYASVLRLAHGYRAIVAAHPALFLMAERLEDLERARESGRLAVVFDLEGAYSIGEHLERIAELHGLGLRWMSLVFNRRNLAGGGCHDVPDDGLTPLGMRLIEALDAVGVVPCCTHVGYRTAREVLGHARGPVIFSHSNALALHEHPRNIPDELIRLCAARGGVVGINGLDIFLGRGADLLERFLDHLEYVIGLVGWEHAGIGLDYVHDQEELTRQLIAARGTWPSGYGYEPGIRFLEPEALPRVADALQRRGHPDAQIHGILGGNFRRVAAAVWKPPRVTGSAGEPAAADTP